MKNNFRSILAVVVVIGLSTSLFGQINYGFKAGINSSSLTELGYLNTGDNMKAGVSAGINLNYHFNDILSLNTELNYQVKGGKTTNHYTSQTNEVDYSFDYLTVPVFLKAEFSEQLGLSSDWGVYGYAGSYYGWLLEASEENSNSEQVQETISDYTSDTDYGATFGLGVGRKINSREVYLDLRYDMGLAEVVSYDEDLRNKTVTLSLGINF